MSRLLFEGGEQAGRKNPVQTLPSQRSRCLSRMCVCAGMFREVEIGLNEPESPARAYPSVGV
jgi:hypothetical protein